MKLSRELWLEIEPLLATGLELEAGERAAWLRSVEATHPQAAPVVRRMLATHERAERGRELESGPRLALPPTRSPGHAAGETIGPYRLVSLLGRGGMGEVWLARHADGRFDRNVALKLPALHEQAHSWRERFQRERDILARLEHPNIARLYDAGMGEGGQPWLAMELVEGLSLSDHVAARSLSMPERLALFRQVLAAVAHAHRHLVVHRDLKPANILVDASGQVKLLDFGIAKLLAGEDAVATSGELTRLGGRVMTLRYAAPEQVAAGEVTTATDIYSLGVILHELVTGLAPYRAVREGKVLTDVGLMQEETTIPSRLPIPRQLARLVSGDLDAIVLKAMRRDPAERYASIELFDADIHAHLERRPVKARAGTWRYLAGRFAARHRLPLALASAVVVTLAVGLVLAERERRVAVAEKARAERHFASVRKLANTFIFDVHGEIERLQGSLKARQMLVKTSLEYLDALAAEAGRDPKLMFEIASAYRNIGSIQGEAGGANLGETGAAVANLEKAGQLFSELEALKPDDVAMLQEHRKQRYTLARAYYVAGDARWKAQIAEHSRLAARIAGRPGATVRDRALVAVAKGEEANLYANLGTGRTPALEALAAEAIAILEALLVEAPGDIALMDMLGGMHMRAGAMLASNNPSRANLEAAIGHLRRARQVAQEVREQRPENAHAWAIELEAIGGLAKALEVAGDFRAADTTMREALALSATLYARDPTNANAATDRLFMLGTGAELALRMGDPERAVTLSREAIQVHARLPVDTRDARSAARPLANAKGRLGIGLLALAQSGRFGRDRRLSMLQEARVLLEEVAAFVAEVQSSGLGYIESSDLEALDTARKGVARELAAIKAT